ncbi:class I SAM-dependent methyltransferase [Subtercola sp. YIM 133946]|uniref:class I SAM-dependent methyltransferase n=1 Tax=Subtercola sp. YIM 133946 TaxID=3118909 RepID=UPI002F93CCC2
MSNEATRTEEVVQEPERRGFGTFGVPEVRQVVALGRSILDRLHSPEGDADAQRALVEGMQPFGSPMAPAALEQMRPLMSFRSDFFDQELIDALAGGLTQVVNCGAGYDDRALRFRDSAVTYFELDVPDVVIDKKERLERIGADTARYSLAGVDFEVDGISEALDALGHDPLKPTLFICEHLYVFLTESAVIRLCEGLFRRAAPGSRLVATIEVSNDGLDPAEVLVSSNSLFGGTAPLKTILPRAEWLSRLDEAGWRVDNPDVVRTINHTDQIQTQEVAASV